MYTEKKYDRGNAIIIGIITLALVLSGGYMFLRDDISEQGSIAEDVTAGDEENVETITEDVVSEHMGVYEAYTPEKLALAEDNDVVLFFHADWCPTCRATDKSIAETGVPEGVVLLAVDYDTETELKKLYGVVVQHTFVQVDAEGRMLKKWSGSSSAAAIAEETI